MEAAIQQVQMLIKAGMVPSDLLTRLPSLPFDELDKRQAPVKVHRAVHEPPKPKKNYIPPHLAARPGYPVPPSYELPGPDLARTALGLAQIIHPEAFR